MVFTQAHASNPSSDLEYPSVLSVGSLRRRCTVSRSGAHRQRVDLSKHARAKRTRLGFTLLAPPRSAPELQALALAAKLASKSQTSLQLQKEVPRCTAAWNRIATVLQCALGWTAQLRNMPFGFARILLWAVLLQLLHRPWRKQTVPCGHSSSVSAAAITPSGLQRCTHCSYSTSRMHCSRDVVDIVCATRLSTCFVRRVSPRG